MKYAIVQSCPVPARLAPTLERILRRSGATLVSCYRGADAEALLHQLGKSSQRELYECWRARRPGCLPANPPGQSTHDLHSDGFAYPGPRGRPLLWWQVGMDLDPGHVSSFIREAAREGFTVTVTYPGQRSEGHHVNFRRAPVVALPALRRGSQGPRVVLWTRRLKRLGYLSSPSWWYNARVEEAVRHFQQTYHQRADGALGPQTARQILVALRATKR